MNGLISRLIMKKCSDICVRRMRAFVYRKQVHWCSLVEDCGFVWHLFCVKLWNVQPEWRFWKDDAEEFRGSIIFFYWDKSSIMTTVKNNNCNIRIGFLCRERVVRWWGYRLTRHWNRNENDWTDSDTTATKSTTCSTFTTSTPIKRSASALRESKWWMNSKNGISCNRITLFP